MSMLAMIVEGEMIDHRLRSMIEGGAMNREDASKMVAEETTTRLHLEEMTSFEDHLHHNYLGD